MPWILDRSTNYVDLYKRADQRIRKIVDSVEDDLVNNLISRMKIDFVAKGYPGVWVAVIQRVKIKYHPHGPTHRIELLDIDAPAGIKPPAFIAAPSVSTLRKMFKLGASFSARSHKK